MPAPESDRPRVGFETARMALARVNVQDAEGLPTVVANAARICAEALGVERVGIWVFDEAHDQLLCRHLYSRASGRLTTGDRLMTRELPGYCRALEECRAIVADDAPSHPLTAELGEYLRVEGITSMLDAPVFRGGKVFGVLCHEHTGPQRKWTRSEVEFAGAVAEIVALVFEQADRARAEAELRTLTKRAHELDRLIELRTLARSVAHDFNNVLCTAIAINAMFTRGADAPPTPDPAELHDELGQALEIGRRLAAELLRFSDPARGNAGTTTAPCVAGIETITGALRLLVQQHAELHVSIDRAEAHVPLRPIELEQIVLNLCVNARDAMTRPGRIELRLGGTHDVVIEVRDDGTGMSDEVKQHLFEPYFTTKAQGTGLGLVFVRDTVERAGGRLELDSVPGRGTTVRLRLPIVPDVP